jgi:Tfp pilus assembly protein PilV
MTINRRRLRDDSGVSLAELLISATISVVLLTMIGIFFTSVVRGTQASAVADTNTRQASTAMSTMVKYFHAATTYPVAGSADPLPAFVPPPLPAVVPTATDVTFYAYEAIHSRGADRVADERRNRPVHLSQFCARPRDNARRHRVRRHPP